MVAFRPLPIALIRPEWAERVVAPAHDSMTDSDRAQFMADNPDSYLSVTRSPTPDTDETIDEMVNLGKIALDRLRNAGAFGDVVEQFYVYEMATDDVVQRALVGGADIAAYATQLIRTHELVHPDRLELLTRHFEVVAAQSSPVALAHRPSEVIDLIVLRTCLTEPLIDLTNHGLTQRVWAVASEDEAAISDELAEEPFYVIDGHHRLGTADRYYTRNRTEAGRWAHVALFAANHLNNLAYHRVLNAMSAEDFFAAMESFEMRDSSSVPTDQRPDELLFYVGESWVLVRVELEIDPSDPLAHLDPVVLHREILGPVFGFGKSDWRISYRPGTETLETIAAEVEAKDEGVLACMRAVTIPELLAVADAGINMPPKSTYFSPKVRSGVFLRPLDD